MQISTSYSLIRINMAAKSCPTEQENQPETTETYAQKLSWITPATKYPLSLLELSRSMPPLITDDQMRCSMELKCGFRCFGFFIVEVLPLRLHFNGYSLQPEGMSMNKWKVQISAAFVTNITAAPNCEDSICRKLLRKFGKFFILVSYKNKPQIV